MLSVAAVLEEEVSVALMLSGFGGLVPSSYSWNRPEISFWRHDQSLAFLTVVLLEKKANGSCRPATSRSFTFVVKALQLGSCGLWGCRRDAAVVMPCQ